MREVPLQLVPSEIKWIQTQDSSILKQKKLASVKFKYEHDGFRFGYNSHGGFEGLVYAPGGLSIRHCNPQSKSG